MKKFQTDERGMPLTPHDVREISKASTSADAPIHFCTSCGSPFVAQLPHDVNPVAVWCPNCEDAAPLQRSEPL
jgi:hypothetical protein